MPLIAFLQASISFPRIHRPRLARTAPSPSTSLELDLHLYCDRYVAFQPSNRFTDSFLRSSRTGSLVCAYATPSRTSSSCDSMYMSRFATALCLFPRASIVDYLHLPPCLFYDDAAACCGVHVSQIPCPRSVSNLRDPSPSVLRRKTRRRRIRQLDN
jgi:hypothetical protein